MNLFVIDDILAKIVEFISNINTIISLKCTCKYLFSISYNLNFNSNRTYNDLNAKFLVIKKRLKKLYKAETIEGLYIDNVFYINNFYKFTNLKYLVLYYDNLFDMDVLPDKLFNSLEYLETNCLVLKNEIKTFDKLKILKLNYEIISNNYEIDFNSNIPINLNEKYFPKLEIFHSNYGIIFNQQSIGKLKNLKNLIIENSNIEFDFNILNQLEKLKILRIDSNFDINVYFPGINFPNINFRYDNNLRKILKNLDEIFISYFESLDIIELTPNLKKLTIDIVNNSKYDVSKIEILNNLKILEIFSMFEHNLGNNLFNNFKYLERLIICITHYEMDCDFYITDEQFHCLTNLTELDIFGVFNLTDSLLKNMNKLEILHVDDNIEITNEGLKYVPNLKTLKTLLNDHITDEGLKYIPKLENLFMYENITDEGLKFVPNLKKLYASDHITDNGLKYVPNLISLDANKNITNKGLKNVLKLEELNLHRNSKITNVKCLKKLYKLLVGSYSKNIYGFDNNRKLNKIDIIDFSLILYDGVITTREVFDHNIHH